MTSQVIKTDQRDIEFDNDKDELKEQLKELLNIGKKQVKFDDIFDYKLAKGLKQKAKIFGINEEAFITSILPVIASQIPIGNQLILVSDLDFKVNPIIWTSLIGKSGEGKTPAQKTIIEPLYEIQQELKDQHQEELEQWKKDCLQNDVKPPRPRMKRAFVTDTTLEGLAKVQANQLTQGFVVYKDELAGFFKGLNKYRNGDDTEQWLSLRDGSPLNITRADVEKEVWIKNPSVSIMGTIQPTVFSEIVKKMGGFDDSNGLMARFLFDNLKTTFVPLDENTIKVEVKDILLDLYKKLRNLNVTQYKLSDTAYKHYVEWYNELKLAIHNEEDDGLRNVMSKMQGTTGTIALLLHLANACLRDENPDQEISLTTLKSATNLASYYIDQYRSFRLENEESKKNHENALLTLLKAIIDLSERKGWLTARDVRNSTSRFKEIAMTEIRSYFVELEKLGYGLTKGEGNRTQYKNLDHNDHTDHKKSKTAASSDSSCSQDNYTNDHKNEMTTIDDHNNQTTTETQKTENCGQDKTVVNDVVNNNEDDHKLKSSNDKSFNDSIGNVVNVVNSQPQQHDSDTTNNGNDDPQRTKLIEQLEKYAKKLENLPTDFVEEKLIDHYTPQSRLAKLSKDQLKDRVESQKLYYAERKFQVVLNEYYEKFDEQHQFHNENSYQWKFEDFRNVIKEIQSMINHQ